VDEDVAPAGPNLLSGAGTSDGRTLVYARRADGVWKTDGAGRSPVQLSTAEAFDVQITHDDRHVVFLTSRSGAETPWIMPIDGGEARQLFAESTGWGTMDVSADGRLLFVSRGRFVICDLPSCATRREMNLPANIGWRPRWTPDGQRIAYVDTSGANVWSVAVEGGPPRQLTRFPETGSGRTIEAFAWARDGTRLAIVHTAATSDIVLIKRLAAER
jgi:Tol biopolymer transport system component